MTVDIQEVKFDHDGLVPAVVQDAASGEVLMVAYMNRESLAKTIETGQTHFWSRSRKELWRKGATSGHTQAVKSIALDCDGDTLLVSVEQTGVACHTGNRSCFFRGLKQSSEPLPGFARVIGDLARVIHERKEQMPEGSYTTKLFRSGVDRILKKVGEEAGEVIIAAKNHSKGEIAWEVSDLLYHLLVLLEQEGVSLEEVAKELQGRSQKSKKEN
jgi:phosphoribosyl-AMP cyclohydrolase / phosphoribosyl-ATP pyrophosphohydrolase